MEGVTNSSGPAALQQPVRHTVGPHCHERGTLPGLSGRWLHCGRGSLTTPGTAWETWGWATTYYLLLPSWEITRMVQHNRLVWRRKQREVDCPSRHSFCRHTWQLVDSNTLIANGLTLSAVRTVFTVQIRSSQLVSWITFTSLLWNVHEVPKCVNW